MVDRRHVDGLMADLGPVLDPLRLQAYAAEGTWLILLDEAMAVVVELDEERGTLVLSADLGVPPAAGRLELYDLLLRYHAQWPATGGVRMALEETGGMVMQLLDIPLAGLDVTTLQAAVTGFAAKAEAWREIVLAGRTAANDQREPAGATGIFMAGMIRG